jgi:hypothetical protein
VQEEAEPPEEVVPGGQAAQSLLIR